MTKRFELDINDEFISIIDNGKKIGLNLYQAVDLLNAFHEENEQLRRQNKALKENSLVDAYFKYIGVKE